MLGVFGDIIQYIIDMGASVMLPIVIAIISICLGIKIGKAIRAGLMIGVGFQLLQVLQVLYKRLCLFCIWYILGIFFY